MCFYRSKKKQLLIVMRREERFVQQISWALSRQLTWAALFLASLVGIIELLPTIRENAQKNLGIIDTDIFCNVFIYIIFNPDTLLFILIVIGVIFSSNQIIKQIENVANKEYELKKYCWPFDRGDWSFPVKLLLRKVKKEDCEKWIVNIYIVYSFWLVISFFSLWILMSQLEIQLYIDYMFYILLFTIGVFAIIAIFRYDCSKYEKKKCKLKKLDHWLEKRN